MAGQGSILLVVLVVVAGVVNGDENYMIGAGIGDVTGPAAEINMMGYAKPDQDTAGIHLRQHSRAFIFADKKTPDQRVVFISVDVGMISINIKKGVLDKLKETHGSMYRADNVMISGTHTHSGVAGFHQYVLYLVTSLGFVRESYDNLVNGIVRSVNQAHADMKPANIHLHKGTLDNSNINRSPVSYLNNPDTERAKYEHNTDHDMVMMKLVNAKGDGFGIVNWFAVHPVSMNNTNHLISADNKGVAELLFEKDMNPGSAVGKGSFIASFANANLGDVSPNLKGPKCSDTGKPCDVLSSTCPGENAACFAQGPGKDMFDSTWIIGQNQYNKAKELYMEKNLNLVVGPVTSRNQYVDMSREQVKINDTYTATTCKPAMGYSFAAGTTDGPGAFSFKQGDKTGNIFWDTVRNLISKPTEELIRCHSPKPILLPTGEIDFPYQWQPTIMDLQILRIGQVVIVGVPGEFTTMSGRRMREAVKKTLLENGFPKDVEVILAGLTNDYASYIATFEEYQVQRYEAASTIFGPHTLQAYIQRYTQLAQAIAKGTPVEAGTPPPDLMDKQISFVPPVVMDTAPEGKEFGDIIDDVSPSYKQGETVQASFVTGHPRNNPLLEKSYLTVEKQGKTSQDWTVVATDSDWETKYHWVRTNELLGHSKAVITWTIPANQEAGVYRIRHFGHHKVPIIEHIEAFSGTSGVFKVMPSVKGNNATDRWLVNRLANRTPKKGPMVPHA